MESLTRLVSESLARHGFDRPMDYRRLHWSRWFRCESHHSLLSVPSKPGVFAIAEEIMSLGITAAPVGTAPWAVQRSEPCTSTRSEAGTEGGSQQPEAREGGRMLAVTKFFEDDDMAFTLDRMLSWQNPMRARLESGRFFIRYVIIEDQAQRRSICNALNQWIASSSELATGIGAHFATSLHVTPVSDAPLASAASSASAVVVPESSASLMSAATRQNSSAAPSITRPSAFPSGF